MEANEGDASDQFGKENWSGPGLLMANIGALMGQEKNLKSVGKECKNLNDCFNLFGEIHEEIQEHLTEDKKSKDCRIYDDLVEAVYKWMFDTDQRIQESKLERSSVKSKSLKSSRVSLVSSKARALEAKAKQAKLEARIAQLDQVEAAKRRGRKGETKGRMCSCHCCQQGL